MTAPVIGGTTSTFRTDSMVEMAKALRRSLLDYTNKAGQSAREYFGERLYNGRAPDTGLVFPYAVMRLQTRGTGQNNGLRLNGDLEVLVHGRPWAQQEIVESVADLFDQAMLVLVMNKPGQGLVFCHGMQRTLMPSASSPVDSEVVTVRLSYTLTIFPRFLIVATQATP